MMMKNIERLCLNRVKLEKRICSDSVIAGMAVITREKMHGALLSD